MKSTQSIIIYTHRTTWHKPYTRKHQTRHHTFHPESTHTINNLLTKKLITKRTSTLMSQWTTKRRRKKSMRNTQRKKWWASKQFIIIVFLHGNEVQKVWAQQSCTRINWTILFCLSDGWQCRSQIDKRRVSAKTHRNEKSLSESIWCAARA